MNLLKFDFMIKVIGLVKGGIVDFFNFLLNIIISIF